MKKIILSYIIILFLLFPLACSKSSNSANELKKTTNDTPSNTAKITEYSVIELYADLTASPTFLEGVWESNCYANSQNNSFNKNRRIFHLDGVFREVASFNDSNCTIRNSRNTVRLFGTMSNLEPLQLYNGETNIEVEKITSNLMSAPIRGFPIPLQDLTLDDLSPHSTTIEVFSIVANRLYVTDDFGPNSYELLGTGNNYLINQAIETEGKTKVEIDQQAIALFNPLGLN